MHGPGKFRVLGGFATVDGTLEFVFEGQETLEYRCVSVNTIVKVNLQLYEAGFSS
jgi:hypothetical protein